MGLLEMRHRVLLIGLCMLALCWVSADARTWTATELKDAGKDNWIWSDKHFDESLRAKVVEYEDVDEPPEVYRRAKVDYPDAAKVDDKVLEGDVVVSIVVDEHGKVVYAQVEKDSGLNVGFEKAAIEAARKTRWHPGEKDGKRVPVHLLQTQQFRFLTTREGWPISKVGKWDYIAQIGPLLGDSTLAPAQVSSSRTLYNAAEEDTADANEKLPEIKKKATPRYPEKARRMGIEGTVWVEVLVGTDGLVHEALIMKDSGRNVGFEESALLASLESKWKPAYKDDQPVALWIAYKVDFRLQY